MKKLIFMLGAFLMFSIASAQTDTTRKPMKKPVKTERRTPAKSKMQKKDTIVSPSRHKKSNDTISGIKDKRKNPNGTKKTTPPPTEGVPDPMKPQ